MTRGYILFNCFSNDAFCCVWVQMHDFVEVQYMYRISLITLRPCLVRALE